MTRLKRTASIVADLLVAALMFMLMTVSAAESMDSAHWLTLYDGGERGRDRATMYIHGYRDGSMALGHGSKFLDCSGAKRSTNTMASLAADELRRDDKTKDVALVLIDLMFLECKLKGTSGERAN